MRPKIFKHDNFWTHFGSLFGAKMGVKSVTKRCQKRTTILEPFWLSRGVPESIFLQILVPLILENERLAACTPCTFSHFALFRQRSLRRASREPFCVDFRSKKTLDFLATICARMTPERDPKRLLRGS